MPDRRRRLLPIEGAHGAGQPQACPHWKRDLLLHAIRWIERHQVSTQPDFDRNYPMLT